MFDRTKEIDVRVLSGGVKLCTVRFPTDAEWCAWRKQLVLKELILPGGKTRLDDGNQYEVGFSLFNKIRVDTAAMIAAGNGHAELTPGPDFDEEDAFHVINRILECDLLSSDKIPEGYAIRMKVIGGGEVCHSLRYPTLKQKKNFQNQAWVTDQLKKSTETTSVLEPSGILWKSLIVSVEGYPDQDGSVPITHKERAIGELLESVRTEGEALAPVVRG